MPYHPSRRRISLQTRHCAALILAGGKGSRLAPITDSRCKPAVQFGGKYRIIDFTLSNCMNAGIRSVGILTQYLPTQLNRHLRLTWGWTQGVFGDAVEPLPAYQGPDGEGWYLGTADAVYQNLKLLEEGLYRYVLILSGDHIYKMDYGEMLSAHIESGADISIGVIGVPLADAVRFGVMQMDDSGRVIDFMEKPAQPPPDPHDPDKALASMGIYIFSCEMLIDLMKRDHRDPDSTHDFGRDIIPKACKVLHVQGYRFEDSQTGVQRYWRDVGTLDSYFSANMDLVTVDPDLDLYDQFWPIWAHQAPAPGAKFVFKDDENGVGEAHNSVVSAGTIVTGRVEHSLLFTYSRVRKKAYVENSLLLPHSEIGRRCVIRNAIIDNGTVIPDDTQIGVDLNVDRQRYHVTESGLVVVTRQMLKPPV